MKFKSEISKYNSDSEGWRKWVTAFTSSDKKAGSPMEAFAQGPMLSMLSQT